MIPAMIAWLRHFLGWLDGQRFPRPRGSRPREPGSPSSLRALHAQQPCRRLTALHKLFWVALRTFWSGGPSLFLVTPRTVVNWHRAGFRLYWTWVSRVSQVGGRKRVSKEVRALIFRMVSENPTWGAPRIHGELLKLGFDLSERSVSRWIRRAPRDPDSVKRWLTFLRNHREVIAAMDFFTVPIQCDAKSQCTLGCTAIERSTGIQTAAQIHAIRPRLGSEPTRTAFRSPWPNGVAERWVGSCRRDLLNHEIILNERHIKRLMSSYVPYYHQDRTHLGLAKDTPAGRPTAIRFERENRIQSFPRLGGLHHRYALAA
jgi:putative transposase